METINTINTSETRNRNTLLKNWRDRRNSNATLKKDETTLQEYVSTAKAMTVCCHKRAKIAIAARTKKSSTSEKLIADRECKKLGSGIAFIRRYAISYQFTKYGSPPESTWAKIGLVKNIMKELNIPFGSHSSVQQVLKDFVKSQMTKSLYDARIGEKRRGRKPLILDMTPQAQIVYNAVEAGLSSAQTAVLVNKFRNSQTPYLKPVSWSAVENFIIRSECIKRGRRLTKKSGKDDEISDWAKARVAQCLQLKQQLEQALLPGDIVVSNFPPLYLDGYTKGSYVNNETMLVNGTNK
jgi:hypothetical protein